MVGMPRNEDFFKTQEFQTNLEITFRFPVGMSQNSEFISIHESLNIQSVFTRQAMQKINFRTNVSFVLLNYYFEIALRGLSVKAYSPMMP